MAELTVRALMIDDDSSMFDLTRELFDERYPGRFVFDWAGSFDDGLAAIRQTRHDVYLVDHRIGGQRGVELVAAVAAECQAPIIVTSEQENHDLDVAALRAGAADYLVRDVRDVGHLEHAIRYALQQNELWAALRHRHWQDRERCLAADMDGYIAKPIRQQEVVAVLRSAVGGLAGKTGLFRLTAEHAAVVPVEEDSSHTAAAAMRRLNWKQALRLVADDRDLLNEVLAAFVEECPQLQARLRQAAADEDWATVAKTSHTLQAALRLFGGEVLDLAIALEDSCKRGPMVENRVRFEKFSGELENVPIEVQGYLQGT